MVPFSLPMNANPAHVQRQCAGIHTRGTAGATPAVWTEVVMDRQTVWRQRLILALAINGAHGAESRAAWCRLWELNEDVAESLGMRRAFRQ